MVLEILDKAIEDAALSRCVVTEFQLGSFMLEKLLSELRPNTFYSSLPNISSYKGIVVNENDTPKAIIYLYEPINKYTIA